jgi:uncharacterized protein (TIRG00374 family)
MAGEPGKRPSWKATLVLGAKVAFSVALFWFLFHTRLDWVDVRRAIEGAKPSGLALAFGVMLASNLLGAFQWNRLLRAADIEIPFWKVSAYYHVGLFFNNFLPANVGGDFARVLDASRSGAASRARAFATVLMDRMIGTVALGGLALLTTLPAIRELPLSTGWIVTFYGGVTAFFAIGVTMLWAVLHPGALRAVERVLARIGLGRLRPALDDLSGRLARFRGQPRLFRELFVIAAGVQVMRIGVHVLVARALGLHVPLPYFFLFVPLLAVIVSLPISLNGIGVREGAGVVLFGLVGVAQGMAFTLQFTTYLVALSVSLIGGVVFLVRIPRRRAEARVERRPVE